ncbi:hypothetical protein ACWCQK_11375 [Streptomyces sp. NPDC002306]
MRSPAELDSVPWHTLTHAYGSAEDVPDLIRALYEEDEDTVEEALRELFGTIHHQGTIYPASAPAVPFLAHAVRHAPGRRDELLMLLAVLADHDPDDVDSPHWPGSPVAAVCAELCRVLPELLPCIEDDERGVRRAALRVVAAVAELLPAGLRARALARVDEVYATDPVAVVRADAVVVLARFGREQLPLDSPWAEVRLAAAVLAAEASGPPYPAELVEIIAEDGADPDAGDDHFPWAGTTTPDGHLTHLLTQDPDAALGVAASWIAVGDLGSRGSWLVREIAETWRDREPEVLDLLFAALPEQRDARAAAHVLRTIGTWIGHLPQPRAEFGDTLHRYAVSGEETAEPALLALVRCRDPRSLELVSRRPEARTLGAAARSFPEAADRLMPVIRRELAAGATGNEAIALVEALLTARYDWTRLAAAEAHHSITGSPDRAVPVLAELVGPSPVGLGALKALAAIGEVPEELRPALRSCAFSPLRLLGEQVLSAPGRHPDEELRALAWRLLAAR